MIAQILTDYIPQNRTLVTCVQNKAINALALKLIETGVDFLVLGARNEFEQQDFKRETKLSAETLHYTAWATTRRDKMVRDYGTSKALALLHHVYWDIKYRTALRRKPKAAQPGTHVKAVSIPANRYEVLMVEEEVFPEVEAEIESEKEMDEEPAVQDDYAWLNSDHDITNETQAVTLRWSIVLSKFLDSKIAGWLLHDKWALLSHSLVFQCIAAWRLGLIERRTRIILSTVDASEKAMRMIEQFKSDTCKTDLQLLDTIILDEAGCVPEWKMPLLTRFDPRLLIMVGDQKQLPPFTEVRGDKYPAISVLEVLIHFKSFPCAMLEI